MTGGGLFVTTTTDLLRTFLMLTCARPPITDTGIAPPYSPLSAPSNNDFPPRSPIQHGAQSLPMFSREPCEQQRPSRVELETTPPHTHTQRIPARSEAAPLGRRDDY